MYTTVSFLVTRLPEMEDERAWKLFEERYTPLLKRYFIKHYCKEHVANDLAQETMQRAAEGLRKGQFRRDQGRLRGWIGGIARNVLRNHVRKAASRAQADTLRTQFWETQEDPGAEAAIKATDDAFDAIWVRTRLSQLLRLAANTFDLRDLRCYFLVEIRRLPIREVAARTNLSESAVFQKRRKVAAWLLSVGPRFISSWEQ